MELIRISEDKIKISLTKAELEAYDLSMENIDCKSPSARKAFRELFIEAKEQANFDTEREKIFVQIFRAKNGGCEIFVSKIDTNTNDRTQKLPNYIKLHYFNDFDALLAGCRALDRIKYQGKASAYLYNGEYYLWLDTENEIALLYADEFCERAQSFSPLYIDEHFATICKGNAVSLLSKF